jgi:hypothetical protein
MKDFPFCSNCQLVVLGLDKTSKLYPLMIHLPLIVIFSLYYKRPWLISTFSVLSGYLAFIKRFGKCNPCL